MISSISDLVFDVVSIALRSGAGDHLPDKTGQEEHDTQYQGDQRQVEQGLVCYGPVIGALRLMHQFRDDDQTVIAKPTKSMKMPV